MANAPRNFSAFQKEILSGFFPKIVGKYASEHRLLEKSYDELMEWLQTASKEPSLKNFEILLSKVTGFHSSCFLSLDDAEEAQFLGIQSFIYDRYKAATVTQRKLHRFRTQIDEEWEEYCDNFEKFMEDDFPYDDKYEDMDSKDWESDHEVLIHAYGKVSEKLHNEAYRFPRARDSSTLKNVSKVFLESLKEAPFAKMNWPKRLADIVDELTKYEGISALTTAGLMKQRRTKNYDAPKAFKDWRHDVMYEWNNERAPWDKTAEKVSMLMETIDSDYYDGKYRSVLRKFGVLDKLGYDAPDSLADWTKRVAKTLQGPAKPRPHKLDSLCQGASDCRCEHKWKKIRQTQSTHEYCDRCDHVKIDLRRGNTRHRPTGRELFD